GAGEGLSTLLLARLVSVVGVQTGHGGAGRLSGVVGSALQAVGIRATVGPIIALYVGIVVIFALLSRVQAVSMAQLLHVFTIRLRQQLYSAVARSAWPMLARSRTSDFVHALTTELERVSVGSQNFLSMVSAA